MFTAAEFRLIKSKQKKDLENLLIKLDLHEMSIKWSNIANDNSKNEFQFYAELDNKIIENICDNLKSESVIDGYIKLLKIGNITFNYGETDNEILNKIVVNKQKIIDGNNRIIEESKVQPPSTQPEIKQKKFDESEDIEFQFLNARTMTDVLYDKFCPEGGPLNAILKNKISYSKKQVKNILSFDDKGKIFIINEDEPRIYRLSEDGISRYISEKLKEKQEGESVLICIKAKKRLPTNTIESDQIETTPISTKINPPFSEKELYNIFEILELINRIVKNI